MFTEEQKKVIDVTFHSVPQTFNKGRGWRLPHNPKRVDVKHFVRNQILWVEDALRFFVAISARAGSQLHERCPSHHSTYDTIVDHSRRVHMLFTINLYL